MKIIRTKRQRKVSDDETAENRKEPQEETELQKIFCKVVVPVLAVSILMVTFFVAEKMLGANDEPEYFALEHTCCLTYDVFSHNQVLEAANTGNLMRWGLAWVNKGSEPQTDPGAEDILAKYNAVYRGSKDEKKIYFTFDLGYEAGYTEKLLDTLKEKNVKAIFFLLANYLERNPELVQRMIDEGHYIGNHTMNHPCLPLLSADEIKKEIDGFQQMLKEKYNVTSEFFRPSKGEYNEQVLKIAQDLGYTTMFWSFGYKDWEKDNAKGASNAASVITSKFHNGMLMLLHSVNGDNAGALATVIDAASEKGYVIDDPINLKKNVKN